MHVDIHRICVPTDFSEAADHAVHYGAALAHQHQAALHLLHVLENSEGITHHPDFTRHGEIASAFFNKLERQARAEGDDHELPPSDENAETHRRLKALETGVHQSFDNMQRNWWENLKLIRAVRYGHAVEQISAYCNKHIVDLVVMGTHGRTGLARIMLGSVTERVLRVSPCPVLVVRHPEHDYTLVE